MIDKIFETDEIEDFELEDTPPMYEVWLLGYDENMHATDFEWFIDDFDSPEEAKKCFDFFNSKETITSYDQITLPDDTAFVEVRVEAVVPDEDEDEGTTCLDVLYASEPIKIN